MRFVDIEASQGTRNELSTTRWYFFFSWLEKLDPSRKIDLFCLGSGKQREPQKSQQQKGELILGSECMGGGRAGAGGMDTYSICYKCCSLEVSKSHTLEGGGCKIERGK